MEARPVLALVDLEELLLVLAVVLVDDVVFGDLAGARLRCWRVTVVSIVIVETAWETVASVVESVTVVSIVEIFETTVVPFVTATVEVDVV